MKILDNRGLEPPEPMQRTLKALSELQSGEKLTIINDKKPMFLFEELDVLNLKYEVKAHQDSGFEVIITK